MKPLARASLWAALSFLVAVLVAGAVGVYGFDAYERAWGRGPSLQVITWVATPISVLVGVFAACGFRLSKSELQRPRTIGVTVGMVTAVAVVLSEVLLPSNSELSGLPLTFALFLLAFVTAVFVPKILSGGLHAA
jgi:hypothetical protein